jgi:periplasmic protein TonB
VTEIAIVEDPRLLSNAVDLSVPTDAAARRSRFAVALAASAVVHAIALVAAIVFLRPIRVEKPIVILPVSLVYRPGGAGIPGAAPGEPAPGPPAAAIEPAPAAPAVVEAPKPVEPPKALAKPAPEPVVKKKVVAKPKPAPETPPSSEVASIPPREADAGAASGAGDASGSTGARGGGGGNGSGGGGGGGGTSASPAYGSNPQPPYPMAARRLGIEGTVVLRVVVAPDGTPKSVVVLESSGHNVLDASALETVRTRWRFVPARRNGIAIEDSVQVPIRFHQTG